MTGALHGFYHDYIACLNRRDWDALGTFVGEGVTYNGQRVGLGGYRANLERDVRDIPDLRFSVALLVVEPPIVASRLDFDCTPAGMFLGLPVNGRRVRFSENVFYEVRDDRIATVWSVIDAGAIAAQLHA